MKRQAKKDRKNREQDQGKNLISENDGYEIAVISSFLWVICILLTPKKGPRFSFITVGALFLDSFCHFQCRSHTFLK
jgi:hypothetical protein